MPEKKIILTIKPDGNVSSEVAGVSGPKCSDLTGWVKTLGEVVEDKNTEDYYKEDDQGVSVSTY